MKIFYAVDHEVIPGSKFWHNNLFLSLKSLGHEVIPFNYNLTFHFMNADPSIASQRMFIEKHRPKLEETLLSQIRVEHARSPIQLFFSYFYNSFCRPEVISEIRSMGICTVNWYCNGSYQFHLVDEIAPAYDYCLVPEEFRLQDYVNIGANPVYFQEAANPNIYKPHDLTKKYDVTFVGQKYGNRPMYIQAVYDAGINVHVWGQGWRKQNRKQERIYKLIKMLSEYGLSTAITKAVSSLANRQSVSNAIDVPQHITGAPISDDELIKMYSRSKISLGFSVVDHQDQSETPIRQVRLRDFEAPMSGAFYMTEYMEELEQFFDIGTEMVCYTGQEDLIEKIQYYLCHESEREKIRLAGMNRARSDHTWQKRFDTLFKSIGLS